jgi:hypothetical protein
MLGVLGHARSLWSIEWRIIGRHLALVIDLLRHTCGPSAILVSCNRFPHRCIPFNILNCHRLLWPEPCPNVEVILGGLIATGAPFSASKRRHCAVAIDRAIFQPIDSRYAWCRPVLHGKSDQLARQVSLDAISLAKGDENIILTLHETFCSKPHILNWGLSAKNSLRSPLYITVLSPGTTSSLTWACGFLISNLFLLLTIRISAFRAITCTVIFESRSLVLSILPRIVSCQSRDFPGRSTSDSSIVLLPTFMKPRSLLSVQRKLYTPSGSSPNKKSVKNIAYITAGNTIM